MVTNNEIREALENKKRCYKLREDHKLKILNLLRERIPYLVESSIITSAEHDKLWLPHIDMVSEFLEFEDLEILQDCNVGYDSDYECLYLFV